MSKQPQPDPLVGKTVHIKAGSSAGKAAIVLKVYRDRIATPPRALVEMVADRSVIDSVLLIDIEAENDK